MSRRDHQGAATLSQRQRGHGISENAVVLGRAIVERADKSDKAGRMNDGTPQLLRWGSSIVGTGILAVVLLQGFLGGMSRTGASTNGGWFALIVALMSIPFGGLLLLLGAAKWLRNRSQARH